MNRSGAVRREERPVRWRKYPHLFLIVCEDGKTEPYYFRTFKRHIPPDTIFLRTVGTGKSSLGVVEQAIEERKLLIEEARKNVDEVWAVFDRDDADQSPGNTHRFEEAFRLASKEDIEVAYSNEVFELWLLLHVQPVGSDAVIPRAEVYGRLESTLQQIDPTSGFVYVHGETSVIDHVVQRGSESLAIERARALQRFHRDTPPLAANPSTTVHQLVERLRGLIKYYSYDPDE